MTLYILIAVNVVFAILLLLQRRLNRILVRELGRQRDDLLVLDGVLSDIAGDVDDLWAQLSRYM